MRKVYWRLQRWRSPHATCRLRSLCGQRREKWPASRGLTPRQKLCICSAAGGSGGDGEEVVEAASVVPGRAGPTPRRRLWSGLHRGRALSQARWRNWKGRGAGCPATWTAPKQCTHAAHKSSLISSQAKENTTSAESSILIARISGWCRVLLGRTRRDQRAPITRGLPTPRAGAFLRTRRLTSGGLRDG